MGMATIATGMATAWLADQAAQSVGLDLGKAAKETMDGVAKAAKHAVDDVVGTVAAVGRLPSNISIGRIINTIV